MTRDSIGVGDVARGAFRVVAGVVRYAVRGIKLLDRLAQSIVASRHVSVMDALKQGTSTIQEEYDEHAPGEGGER